MKLFKFLPLFFIIANMATASASTPAGTSISNQASVTFSQNNNSGFVIRSNVAVFTVNEIIDVQINWADNSQISVSSPDYNKVLTFKLTNIGNGKQQYNLNVNPNNINGSNFNPIAVTPNVYVENNLQSGLQLSGAYIDTTYSPGALVNLEPNETKYIYLVYNIPSNLLINNKSFVQIEAVSNSVGTNNYLAGTIIHNNDGSQSLLGHTLGKSKATGNFITNSLQVTSTKSVLNVKDSLGGNIIQSQSILTYQISLDISGSGKASRVQIVDALPVELDYIPNSLLLNNTPLSDNDHIIANKITIPLGDLIAPQKINLIFQTKIK